MDRDSRAAADFAARRRAERVRLDAQEPKPIDQALVSAINRWCDMRRPHERKRELANLVRSRVHCRGMHHVEAERAAEYVVYGDQNGRYLPERVLLKLLDELDEADRKGQIETYVKDNQVYSNRGKWFVGVLKKRLREHDVQQQKCKRRPEQ